MIYQFDDYELDVTQAELRFRSQPQKIEPRTFDLLQLLLENAGELLTKDDLVEHVWHGRIVSDSAVTSCIKAARQAVGDDGNAQRLIKTVYGRGVRFVAPVSEVTPPTVSATQPAAEPAATPTPGAAPSIAILPFQLLGDAGAYAAIAEALPHELIAELARLRWLFVIARGSSFRFRSEDADVKTVGQALGVHYCVTGTVELLGPRLAVTVDMVDTRDGGVVWADRYGAHLDHVHDVRAQIVANIIAAAETQIVAHESRRASQAMGNTENLDAWTAYHLGVRHMYRFNKEGCLTAGEMFQRAVSMDPEFCRAHAGLSYTHFQNAVLQYTEQSGDLAALARSAAERSYTLDPLDPFANLTMGRSLWLDGRLEDSLAWLTRAIELSPNYAQGVYAKARVEVVTGEGEQGQAHADAAMALSPIDPMLYAMLGTRALSHLVREDYAQAVEWSEKAAAAPGAEVMVDMISAIARQLDGDAPEATRWARSARERLPGVSADHFFRSFPFAGTLRERFAGTLAQLDF